jgi:hypothetical protein
MFSYRLSQIKCMGTLTAIPRSAVRLWVCISVWFGLVQGCIQVVLARVLSCRRCRVRCLKRMAGIQNGGLCARGQRHLNPSMVAKRGPLGIVWRHPRSSTWRIVQLLTVLKIQDIKPADPQKGELHFKLRPPAVTHLMSGPQLMYPLGSWKTQCELTSSS